MNGRRRYSSIWHAIMRGDEIETDTNETHATWHRPYNRDEDNVSELPPPHAMEAEADDAAETAAILEWWNSTM